WPLKPVSTLRRYAAWFGAIRCSSPESKTPPEMSEASSYRNGVSGMSGLSTAKDRELADLAARGEGVAACVLFPGAADAGVGVGHVVHEEEAAGHDEVGEALELVGDHGVFVAAVEEEDREGRRP